MSRVICIIPARYQSSRFEGKPLATILGKPMIQHVYERALQSNVVSFAAVATDDQRIYDAVTAFGGNCIMTAEHHRSGTDRIAEAVESLHLDENDIVINTQGDQPFFEPLQLQEVIAPFASDTTAYFSTLIYKIRRDEEIYHPNAVKVVFDNNRNALYFSRATIPYVRDAKGRIPYYKHHGIYAYRHSFLRTFAELEQGTLEKLEMLEQLRALEHGYQIRVVETKYDSIEVDTREELERVEAAMKEDAEKKAKRWSL